MTRCCAAACPIIELEQTYALGAITFEATERIELKKQTATAFVHDMICAFAFDDCVLPEGLNWLDATTRGALEAKIRAAGFAADFGQQLIIDVHALGAGNAEVPHYVMLIGLGGGFAAEGTLRIPRTIPQTLCSSGGAIAQAVSDLQVTELSIDFGGLARHNINLLGMAGLLRCRLAIEINRLMLDLDTVKVICDRSELPLVRFGLAQEQQLCPICSSPTFGTEAQIS